MAEWKPKGAVPEEEWTPSGAVLDGDSVVRAPDAPGPESIAMEPYGPQPDPVRADLRPSAAGNIRDAADVMGIPFPSEEEARGAVASFLQGPALNWADEMAGLHAKQVAAIGNIGRPSSEWTDPEEAYRAGRDAFRGAEGTFREENPKTAFGLTVAGGLGAPSPGAFAPAFSTRAAGAAATGALAGAGAADEQEDVARMAALGAPLGMAAQGLGEGVGTILGLAGRVAPWLQDTLSAAAESRAVKAATGQNKRAIKSMVERGLADADTGTVEAIGRDLLETGTVTAGASTREIMERAAAATQTAGRGIGEALKELDALTPPGFRLSADELADQAEQRLILPLLDGTHGQQQLAQRLMPEVNALRAQGTGEGSEVTLAALEQFKRGLDDTIGPGGWAATEPRPVVEALRRLRGFINDVIEERATAIGRETGSDAAERYLANKRIYGSMRTARDVSRDQVAGQLSNRLVSPSDYGTGATGALVASLASGGDPLMSAAGGAAAAGLNKFARERGNQVAAAGLDRLAGSDWLDDLAKTNPEAMGRFGAYLGAAASRSPEALSVAKYELGQLDPEYQEERRRQGGQQQ